ncbi:MAG: MerR family transcriptional regulator [Planctomycetota bacterium]|nr:MAG: MerR family transcriptional regulator [Planctomycetota bacterium]
MALETTDQRSDDPVISIGILASKVGLSVSTVRKYEIEGLLIAHRSASGRRMFSLEDIDRVRKIKHMIREVGLNIEGIRRIQALLPCWDLFTCDDKKRKQCSAYREAARPCWMVKHVDCTGQDNDCRKCIIYRFGSQCTEDIKEFLHEESRGKDQSEAMRKLMRRSEGDK